MRCRGSRSCTIRRRVDSDRSITSRLSPMYSDSEDWLFILTHPAAIDGGRRSALRSFHSLKGRFWVLSLFWIKSAKWNGVRGDNLLNVIQISTLWREWQRRNVSQNKGEEQSWLRLSSIAHLNKHHVKIHWKSHYNFYAFIVFIALAKTTEVCIFLSNVADLFNFSPAWLSRSISKCRQTTLANL